MNCYLPSITVRCLLILSLLLTSCATQRQAVPPGVVPKAKTVTVAEEQYGHQVLSALTQRWQIDYNHPKTPDVSRIVNRLVAVADGDKEPWHVYVLKDDSLKNAAATRGNHLFIWTGMLNATKNDGELATVLSHEVAHVLARHTDPDPNEELKKLLINLGAVAAQMAVASTSKGAYWGRTAGNVASSATQEIGSGFMIYPYSREREAEADQIALFMMADARFDPRSAIDFWDRAKNDPSFGSGLSFFASHPAPEDRLEKLKAILPLAMLRYKGKGQKSTADKAAISENNSDRTASRNPDQTDPRAKEWEASDSQAITGTKKPPNAPPPSVITSPYPPKLTTPGDQPVVSRWRVVRAKAVLYRSPSTSSKALGEFKRGTIVNAIAEKKYWIEIAVPDAGFIRKSSIEHVSALDSLD